MEFFFLKRKILFLLIIIYLDVFLSNNYIHEGRKLSNEKNLGYEDYLSLYKNYSANLKTQQEILERINSLVLNKKKEIGDLMMKLGNLESEQVNKLSNESSSSNINSTKIYNENIDENSSSLCNERNECLNIIDIQDYFMINMEPSSIPIESSKINAKAPIIQTDIFKIKGLFDILNRNQGGEVINDSDPEYVVDFLVVDLKNLITRNPTIFSNLVFKRNSPYLMNKLIFILILTNKSLKILDYNYNIIENHNFEFKSNILKSDFSFLEEDNSIIIITQNFDILSITLEFDLITIAHKLNLIENFNNKGEKLKIENTIINDSSKKSSSLNLSDKIVFLGQHTLHANKYIVIGLEKGTILVLNKDLEMRLTFTLNKPVNTLFLNNGVLGVIYGKSIDFFNLLGGNSVLISCFGYNTILNAVVDNLNNMLIIYDTAKNIIFYDLKLSISRVSANECYPIYRLDTIPIEDIETKQQNNLDEIQIKDENEEKYFSSTKDTIEMQIYKNFLFLMRGNIYLFVLDLSFNHKNPEIERVVHYKEFLLNTSFENNKIKAFNRINDCVDKRNNYMDTLYENIFKISLINKNEIFIISKLSNFDLGLFDFSPENFSMKNFFLSKDYLESTLTPINEREIKEYHLISKNKDNSKDDKLHINNEYITDYNVFNLKTSKILEDCLFIKNQNLIFKLSNNILSKKRNDNSTEDYLEADKYGLKNNLYYRIFYSNINSFVIYTFVILVVTLFSFLLRLYYNKKKEEKERLIKEKMEELQKLNLNKLKGRTNMFENDENLLNKPTPATKIDNNKKDVNENQVIQSNNLKDDKSNTDESKIKRNFMNLNKAEKSSDEDNSDDFSNENKINTKSIDAKASIRNFINREKNNTPNFKNPKFKEDSC